MDREVKKRLVKELLKEEGDLPSKGSLKLFMEGAMAFFRNVLKGAPPLAIYYLTHRCNQRCSYCDIPVAPYQKKEFENPVERIVENLIDLSRLGVRFCDFTGGEPLLYKELPKVLRAAKRLGIFTIITTNGTLFRKRAKELVGLIDDLKFSISTLDPDLYKRERGTDTLDEVIKAIKLAVELGWKPTLLPTITEYNIDGIPSLIQWAKQHGLMVMLRPEFGYFSGNKDLPIEKAALIWNMLQNSNTWTNKACLLAHIKGGNKVSAPRCRSVSAAIVISPDDKIVLPGFYCKKVEIPIGDSLYDTYKKSGILKIWKEEEGEWDFCEGCSFYGNYESGFLWPPDTYFYFNMVSRIEWLYMRRILKPVF